MLRVTIELVPCGIANNTYKVAVVEICNDGTGTASIGNYDMRAEGITEGGWDLFFKGKVMDIERGDYLNQALDCMKILHSER